LNEKNELLKEQGLHKNKVHELEEQLTKYKTSEIIMEERSRSVNAEVERLEARHREDIKEYKKKIQELEESLKSIQETYEKQLLANKEEHTKKEVEASKTLVFQEQQLKFLQEKVNDSQSIVMSKDKEISILTDRLKYLENEVHNGRGEVDESSKVLEVENAVLKKQLEMVQGQILENKASYSAIIESMNKNLVEALQEKTTLTLTNKELTLKAENTQQQLTILEGKLYKLNKYREVIHAAKYIECKGCLSSYTSNAFLTHVKMCQRLAGRKENFPTERGHCTMRNTNFEQVLVCLLSRNIKLM
jgi:chromosome segregation ATPase